MEMSKEENLCLGGRLEENCFIPDNKSSSEFEDEFDYSKQKKQVRYLARARQNLRRKYGGHFGDYYSEHPQCSEKQRPNPYSTEK
ncbi:hypothetical protein BpHYR1_021685 [Brachionus plicatilis]|uniref:Uncharacterized protein n=1 Tax=Brachionus plicatilis TaxID=10195 RepID=A0A3M7RUJ4_BRAPC|nr:hypothetical protein BpHYR1_021685 [Brachionus plicatilis]